MMLAGRSRLYAAWVALAIAIGCGACARQGDPVVAARERAVAFFAEEVHELDPGWVNLFGYMHRRFGLEARAAGGEPLHDVPIGDQRRGWGELFRRLSDPSAAVGAETVAAISSQTDRMTALALHCDRLGLPGNWNEVLEAAARTGGYALTHSALAGRFSLENGCVTAAELEPVVALQREALAGLAASRDAVERELSLGTDVWIEALAMLYYIGAGDEVEPSMIASLLASQRRDGGWAAHPSHARSDPHATALAIWVLLENEEPHAPPIRWVPPSRG